MKGHSKLFYKPMVADFFEGLNAIAPEYLNWHEADGKLICIQKPVAENADPTLVNTVDKVLLKLRLSSVKPEEIIEDKKVKGQRTYIFALKEFTDKLNAKPWSRAHVEDFAGVNAKKQ